MSDDQVGKRIREAMIARGYKREDGEPDVRNFAFDFRFDKGHLYAWLTGKMKPFKNIVELCEALDVSIDWLLKGKEYSPKGRPGKARLKSLVLTLAACALGLSPNSVRADGHPLSVAQELNVFPLIGSRRLGIARA